MTLIPFGPDLWIADGPVVEAAAGFHYPTRMVLVRLESGDLFVWSPVRISHALQAEVDAIGPVRHLIAPNGLHHVFLADWLAVYPQARAHAAPGLRQKRPDIAFATDLGDVADEGWSDEIEQVVVANRITTEVVFFHRRSRTVLITDLLQQFPSNWFSGWRAAVAWMDGMIASEPCMPAKFRLAFLGRPAGRTALSRILAWPTDKIVMAHAPLVERGGRALLSRAFARLSEPAGE
ncbi:DUF4336 domain-containing protein [Jiella marina]|uniref:DUF4336 domain-containing protein n=1 Tax=Jiella sp. LLJ827 TaxID=2917712 RepID=UPI002100F589|nr:DUF4336 domain-containing protein [Jiella sp. LLJ827]MCQ0986705.1 DUF4336 domain-containing protein [Jiella sp. LLJ827]